MKLKITACYKRNESAQYSVPLVNICCQVTNMLFEAGYVTFSFFFFPFIPLSNVQFTSSTTVPNHIGSMFSDPSYIGLLGW
jgi:hypothetical protein